ncbi:single-stranded-DNA-specific exonuclease RecJ, partial [Pelagibacteraceae bacterium]|nr:single-stranded-DNA-specific exonuclease RecJ [Pelagibacteraceae bacterium]
FINSDIFSTIPNPYELKDMETGIIRCIDSIKNKDKIGIIADYDVDGSTSASILFNFLKNYTSNLILKVPNRLSEGYGPNMRLMQEMLDNKVKLLFTLDCGTSSFNIIDNPKFKKIDVIVIDHHLSEFNLPKVNSIINPNRYDENNEYKDFAAVGVTFLFLMALRKKIRETNLFPGIKEPNLLSYLDLVALGTICDIVNLNNYNRLIVKKGLELIIKRQNKSISKIIDNSKINFTPTATDIGYSIGPQINAASRIDDSSLASKLLISKDESEIEIISKKLFLMNEKRKLIEQNILEEALSQIKDQTKNKFILVYSDNWHQGVLGIVASKIVSLYNKPTFIFTFENEIGIGSGRSINKIDIGTIILELKNNNLIEEGGGHKMAVGLKIKKNQLENLVLFLEKKFSLIDNSIFTKQINYDEELSVNQINNELLNTLDLMEPFGKGNEQPIFLIKDISINNIKVVKEKHIFIFFQNDIGINLKGILFNSKSSELFEYLSKYNHYKFEFLCTVKRDNFSNTEIPQIHIVDVKVIN